MRWLGSDRAPAPGNGYGPAQVQAEHERAQTGQAVFFGPDLMTMGSSWPRAFTLRQKSAVQSSVSPVQICYVLK